MLLLSPSPALGASWANALGSFLPSQFATSSRDVPFLSGEVTPPSGSPAAFLMHHQWMVLSDFLGSALIIFVYVVLFGFSLFLLYFVFLLYCIICVYYYNYYYLLIIYYYVIIIIIIIIYCIIIIIIYCILKIKK